MPEAKYIGDFTPLQVATILANFRANQFRDADSLYKERIGDVVKGLETRRGLEKYRRQILDKILEIAQDTDLSGMDRFRRLFLRICNRDDIKDRPIDDRSLTEQFQTELDELVGVPQRKLSRFLP